MTKKELLGMLCDWPDDYEIVVTDDTAGISKVPVIDVYAEKVSRTIILDTTDFSGMV